MCCVSCQGKHTHTHIVLLFISCFSYNYSLFPCSSTFHFCVSCGCFSSCFDFHFISRNRHPEICISEIPPNILACQLEMLSTKAYQEIQCLSKSSISFTDIAAYMQITSSLLCCVVFPIISSSGIVKVDLATRYRVVKNCLTLWEACCNMFNFNSSKINTKQPTIKQYMTCYDSNNI